MSFAFLEQARRTWGLHTLGLRLVLGYALLFVASTVLLAALAYVLFNHFMREPDRAFMMAQAYELAQAYERGGIEALRRELADGSNDERRGELLVRLADAQGRTVLVYNPDDWREAEVAQLARHLPVEGEEWIALGPAEDEDALEAFALRLPDGYVMQVGMDADLRADAMESIQEVFIVIALPVLVLALLVGGFMAYRALLPIRRLVETVQSVIDTGDVKTRVAVEGARGEFADLIHIFNRMLGRVEALVNGLRDTLDNIAHDLRTPLTRLRGRAELALQDERRVDEYREALVESLEASESVETILTTIMDVAEVESGTMPLNLESLRVSDVVEDVVGLYYFVAEAKDLTIEVDVAPEIRMMADPSRIRQLLANLLDNAVKYTPPGGRIVVVAGENTHETVLTVRDTGIGIPEAEQPRIWDRLYRGDRSRAERGLGLGLSLVRAVAQAHGGRVDVESEPGTGSMFTVRVPKNSGAPASGSA